MKKFILIISFVFLSSVSFAQLVNENFDYPQGDSLTQHGWIAFSGANNALFVTSPGLTFPGYPLSGIGNATSTLLTSSSSQDAYTPFSQEVTSGSVYTSFMVNVDSAALAGNYFVSYLPSNSNSNYYGRVYVKETSNGNLAFGISKSSTSSINEEYSDSIYSKGTTYLLVLKYEFKSDSTNDDEISLFVFNSNQPLTEPAPTVGPITTTQFDAFNIGKIAIRQGASGSAVTPTATIDGIRVTTAWMPSIWNIKLAVQGLYNSGTRLLNKSDTVIVYVRNNTSPYALVDSAISVIDSVGLNGNFEFDNAADGNYYFEVVYRKSPVFRNGISTWSKTGGVTISRANGSYDFTTAASQAFGNNQQLAGSVYTIFNGDVDQDGSVDLTDLITTLNASSNFESGYLNTDVNGDNIVNLADILLVFNNTSIFVTAIAP